MRIVSPRFCGLRSRYRNIQHQPILRKKHIEYVWLHTYQRTERERVSLSILSENSNFSTNLKGFLKTDFSCPFFWENNYITSHYPTCGMEKAKNCQALFE